MVSITGFVGSKYVEDSAVLIGDGQFNESSASWVSQKASGSLYNKPEWYYLAVNGPIYLHKGWHNS